ncbi:hypothetical protein [Atopobacter phocae]|uniref:hypothetical protein n=1 Tax=Atopobacter phocae TaxID=136492 RepID=UPI00046FD2A7|nr:hypothetical protein [Atopobacter phocae]
MNSANLDKIKKILEQQTAYRIYKDTGIAQTTISRWTTGKTPLENMSLKHAITLTSYYDQLNKPEK